LRLNKLGGFLLFEKNEGKWGDLGEGSGKGG